MRDPKTLIDTAQLAEKIGQPNLRIFDCTTYLEPPPPGVDEPYIAVPGRHTFEAAHIPGADFLDLQGEFSDSDSKLRFMLPSTQQLEKAFGRHGIDENSEVVLYSIGTMMWATRFWWMLRSLSFGVSVLNGGFDKWQAEGRPTESGPPKGHAPATFKAKPRSGYFIGKSEVLAVIGKSDSVIVNALQPQFYKGLEPSRYGRPGRIPDSVNVPAATLVDAAAKTLVPLADAETRFTAQGITKDKTIVAYCGGGISATIDLFMLHQLGYDHLTLYDASMGEWAKDTSLPIQTD